MARSSQQQLIHVLSLNGVDHLCILLLFRCKNLVIYHKRPLIRAENMVERKGHGPVSLRILKTRPVDKDKVNLPCLLKLEEDRMTIPRADLVSRCSAHRDRPVERHVITVLQDVFSHRVVVRAERVCRDRRQDIRHSCSRVCLTAVYFFFSFSSLPHAPVCQDAYDLVKGAILETGVSVGSIGQEARPRERGAHAVVPRLRSGRVDEHGHALADVEVHTRLPREWLDLDAIQLD